MARSAASRPRPAPIDAPDVGSVHPGGVIAPGGAEDATRLVPEGAFFSREGCLGALEGLARAVVAGEMAPNRAEGAANLVQIALRDLHFTAQRASREARADRKADGADKDDNGAGEGTEPTFEDAIRAARGLGKGPM